ncbi:DUF4384 domain-containing protein [Corticibacter populi]|uniref:DUF4384 domain-containing protein n=2 Tax=Corticibacter populi TaxID=1550736 RepID=A0A3M6QV64_9BURK|nr:DUF4384 domain-containing protein [Corticibacter populi]RMX06898.1 DUF4384 domain-containing protein [Corticibacter populi]
MLGVVITVASWLGGCATPLDARKDREFQSNAHVHNRPTHRPVRSFTSFSDSLTCMDHMLRAADMPTTLITSKYIPDYSGRVSVATKDMIITALSQMSRVSNAFRYVDFEVELTRQDTVQNLTTILLNNNQLRLQRPALYLSGAIAFVDQNVINNRWDMGTSASRLETGYSANRNATLLGLEMHLGDFRTRTFIPGLDSSNEIIIANGGQGLDLAGRISDYGVHFNVGRDYTQGVGIATRTLVELAMIELLGKWARLPYWQCLTLDQAHPDFQRQLRDWYNAGNASQHRSLVQRSLASQGYLPADVPLRESDSQELRLAVARFQADHGMVVTGRVDFTTYERALRQFVEIDEEGRFTRIGWETGGRATGWPPQTQHLAIDLQVENPVIDRTRFESGTPIYLSSSLSRSAHLYCFMSNGHGQVIRLLPNAAMPHALLSANQTVRIPDWMSPNPGFLLDAGQPGTETVGCFASTRDMAGLLPGLTEPPALSLLGGVQGIDGVQQAFTQALGEGEFASQRVQWQVLPAGPAMQAAPAPAAPSVAPPAAPSSPPASGGAR